LEGHIDVPTAEGASERVSDPIAQLAILLKRWRLKPRRNPRWLHEFWRALEEREPAACVRYRRVAALGLEMGRLLGLPPWSRAAIRGSALLSALMHATRDPAPTPREKTADLRRWEEELRGWRWLQVCADILDGSQPGYEASPTLARHGEYAVIERRVLALAEDFDDLTAGGRRTLSALHALSAGAGRHHDPRLIEVLLSEAGQAACHSLVRRRSPSQERIVSELEESVQLLEQHQPGPVRPVRRQTVTRHEASTAASSDIAAPPEGPPALQEGRARPQENEERREEMSRTTASEETSTRTRASGEAVGTASLAARVAAAARELEEIRAAATRGLEALASITPAIEELSALVSRLQASLLLVNDGGSAPQPGRGPNGLQSIDLRVEHAQGALNVEEVVDALDTLRDLRDLQVLDRGSSWAVLRAQTDADADLAILEAKVTGSLTRRLGGTDGGEAVKVTILQSK
jgi:hypothetical protein